MGEVKQFGSDGVIALQETKLGWKIDADGNFEHWSNSSIARGTVNDYQHYFADVNGDGMADWIQMDRDTNNGWIGLATGNGNFEYWSNSSIARGAFIDYEHYFADANGDGMADWIQVDRDTNNGWVGWECSTFCVSDYCDVEG